jgi:Rrf2 family iron-sulfur cluster assembly transcriptional regulator
VLSKTGIHALTAMASLTRLPEGVYVGSGELAEQIGAPPNYLGKLLKTLADAGIVQSQKGKGGGFRLARNPATVSLLEVVEPIEHFSRWSGCFLGHPRCSDQSACAVHNRWKQVRDVYLRFLGETTIADLAGHGALAAEVGPALPAGIAW